MLFNKIEVKTLIWKVKTKIFKSNERNDYDIAHEIDFPIMLMFMQKEAESH